MHHINRDVSPNAGNVLEPRHIEIYHNLDSRFAPYEPRHTVTEVISTWRWLPAAVTPEQIAEWAFYVFNGELTQLGVTRALHGGEEDFLIAAIYRLLRRRSMSTGDVIAVTTRSSTTWLACEPGGWRRIATPTRRTGEPLSPDTIHQLLWGHSDA
ncbi:hypothetical protein Aca07nite_72130 [Actinoplanes capillaceus]|uniref:Uncharacterized protein n=1 Tax=Actinoplanes campanulatus TaxID=113559 RepID=A0ABQ3WUU9_9ACTN|nr:hypothetical protein [Actinoplanes capillaceus]GID49938.1 hypothetical protein Aca07nite_72130 [Actinoplanes capillaceus]